MRYLNLIFIISSALVFAQQTTTSEADLVLDDMFALDSLEVVDIINDLKKQDYIYTNVIFNNKTLFSGRDFGVEQYSIFPSVSYMSSNNFFLNVGSGYYSGINPQWDFMTFGGGYSNYIDKKKKLLGSIIYSYSTFTQDVANLNNQRISASLSVRLKWFRNSLSGGYLFGGAASHYISNNTYFSIDLFDARNISVSLEPRFGMFWGSQAITEFVRTGIFTFEEVNSNVFQQLNSEVQIPLAIDFGDWDFELGYSFSFPNPLPTEDQVSNKGYFSFSIGYLIGL